jgi:hypothetical protein
MVLRAGPGSSKVEVLLLQEKLMVAKTEIVEPMQENNIRVRKKAHE